MIRYVSAFKTTLQSDQGDRLATLIWGDPVRILDVQGDRTHIKARRQEGSVTTADLNDTSLFEVYVIDVGQGDGVLFKTPDGKWHLVDAGVSNGEQMLKKGMSNFLHWKFIEGDRWRQCGARERHRHTSRLRPLRWPGGCLRRPNL